MPGGNRHGGTAFKTGRDGSSAPIDGRVLGAGRVVHFRERRLSEANLPIGERRFWFCDWPNRQAREPNSALAISSASRRKPRGVRARPGANGPDLAGRRHPLPSSSSRSYSMGLPGRMRDEWIAAFDDLARIEFNDDAAICRLARDAYCPFSRRRLSKAHLRLER
jgi:hypothetical protein